MQWNDVRIFLTVAETGSLSAAARRLKLSQPTVGRRIQSIEHALGLH
ncbi:MAG TPA: LysR family transcriptional regulator, partial [Candidatus Angelobacter sp.]|nr:LysR family transcriptional regulator [Candidatus Angelobacter sp.]